MSKAVRSVFDALGMAFARLPLQVSVCATGADKGSASSAHILAYVVQCVMWQQKAMRLCMQSTGNISRTKRPELAGQQLE